MATPSTPDDIRPAITEFTAGEYTGQCKWWSNRLNYGFITVLSPRDKGVDLFCHHTGIKPLNSKYRTLRKGEYCNFDVVDGAKGKQAVNVTGIGGGPLMCDVTPYTPRVVLPQGGPPPPPPPHSYAHHPPPPFGYGYGQPYYAAPPVPQEFRRVWQPRPPSTIHVEDSAAWPRPTA